MPPHQELDPSAAVFWPNATVHGDHWAAVFPTELGWMACLWSQGRLAWNSFGFETALSAGEALQAAGRSGLAMEILMPASVSLSGSMSECGLADCPSGLRDVACRLVRFAISFEDRFLDVPLACHHLGPFTRRVVEACRALPPGRTASYADLAAAAGSPGAARAVGNAMARNRFPLIVPCHRVVGAGGHLGGYSAPQGLAMKRRLLEAEARLSVRKKILSPPRTLPDRTMSSE